jgi:two-component system OmpR family sensor kinase/two-component system sensor histidine kinase BaeS
MRGRFMRRIGLFALVFLILVVAGATLLAWLIARALGGVDIGDVGRGVLLVLFLLLARGAWVGARGVRRIAAPLADVIEAAARVEAGDYSVRVDERGPRVVRSLAHAFNAMSERLETSDEQRRRLLADVTHELRTPLTIMQGNLEALLDGVHPADARHLEPILDETRVLSRLVDDLRTLSLAEAGALALHREPTDIARLVADTVASFRAQADAAGAALVLAIDAELPQADVDPVRLREVLANLLSNALRYSPRGRAVHVGASAADGRVRVWVRDAGPGIAAEALPHVFDRFYKSEESRGAGLGLAIAKGLVVAHGGEIEAKSVPGEGTEVIFTVPV